MGKIIRNGLDYSGLINANGVFIDTKKVIKSNTTFRSSMSYTATEDCYISLYIVGAGDVAIRIDNNLVGGIYVNGLGIPFLCPFKKGQTIAVSGANSGYDSSYIVYGVLQGSNILPDYSTTEHKTGRKWIDGKDIYEKTFTGLSVTLNGDNWIYWNPSGITGIFQLISLDAYFTTNGTDLLHCAISEYMYNSNDSKIQLSGFSGYERTIDTITIQYTKS